MYLHHFKSSRRFELVRVASLKRLAAATNGREMEIHSPEQSRWMLTGMTQV